MKCVKDLKLNIEDSYIANASVVVMLQDFWKKVNEEYNEDAARYVCDRMWKCLRKSCKYVTVRDVIVGLRKLEVLLVAHYLKEG